MKRRNLTTCIAAVLLGMTITASGAFATEYETNLAHRSPYNYAWTNLIYVSPTPFVDYAESVDESWLTLDGLSTNTGGELDVFLDLNIWGGNGNLGRVGLLSSEWGKTDSVTDLVFSSISNPGGGGQIDVSLDLELSVYWLHSSTSNYCEELPGGMYRVDAGSQFGATRTETAFSDPVPQGVQPIIGPSATVDLDVPQAWHTWLIIQPDVYTSNNCGDNQHSRTECQSTLLLGALNLDGTIGPVFNLPPGYTANAPSIGLVDNYFQAASAPCPGDLDGDLDVDLSDLAQLLANYGVTSGAVYGDGDLDADGDVDLSDLAALLAVYGSTCP